MPLEVACPQCGQVYRVPASRAGSRARCKRCNAAVHVPAAAHEPLADLPDEATASGAIGFAADESEPVAPPESGARQAAGPSLDEHLELAKRALATGQPELAEPRLLAIVRETSDAEPAELLQEALKLQIPWVPLARAVGMVAPHVPRENLSRFRKHLDHILILGPLIAFARVGRDPRFETLAVTGVAALFCLVACGRIGEAIATVLVRRGQLGWLAVTRGDAGGAVASIALRIASIAAAVLFATSRTVPWILVALALAFAADALHVVFRTRGRWAIVLVSGYFAAALALAAYALLLCAQAIPPGNLKTMPPVPMIWLAGALAALWLTRAARLLAQEYTDGRSRLADDGSYATRPGGLRLSQARLRRLEPPLYGLSGVFFRLLYPAVRMSALEARTMIADSLARGDSQPAMVVSVKPLIVAAYSSDLDAAALLEFPDWLVSAHNLSRGTRLVTVNTYFPMQYRELGDDLTFGPDSRNVWGNFSPYIADFLCDDAEALAAARRRFGPQEWERLAQRAAEQSRRNIRPRDGRPMLCGYSRARDDS